MSQFIPADKQALHGAVEYVLSCSVPGDIAEFGCYLGRTAAMLAESMRDLEKLYDGSDNWHGIPQRKLWTFDSFEGFPAPSHPVDAAAPHVKAGVWYAGQPKGATPEDVHAMCAEFLNPNRVCVVKGWYKDVLPKLPARLRFAIVHIDCDFYESTKQVLDHLLGHGMLSDGCTILFDDWYCNRGSPDYGEQRAWADAWSAHRGASPIGYRFSDWGPYGVVGRRFIVHGGKQ